jgi:hypothetical protein
MDGALCNDYAPYVPPVPAPGWARAGRRAHYFDPFRSLCWRWEYEGSVRTVDPPDAACRTCARKHARRRASR